MGDVPGGQAPDADSLRHGRGGSSRDCRLLGLLERVRQVLPLEGSDLTDYWGAGGSLRDWIRYHLGRLQWLGSLHTKQQTSSVTMPLLQRLDAAWDS